MRLYFRWKLFAGFFGFALVVAGLLVAWLILEVSRGQLVPGTPEVSDQFRNWLLHFLLWALVVLGLVSIPPALWIASRLNRPIRLLHEGMREVADGRLDTVVPPIRTYDEFELLVDHFNRMMAGLRELIQTRMQLQVARQIQRSLLPAAAPSINGFELAGASHPAEAIGGDYFDFLPMCEGRLGLVISDVAGHGIGSALVMAATRTCLRSLVAANYCSVKDIVCRANKVLHDGMPDNCYVTLTFLQLDPSARLLRYVNCGHSTGYLLDSEGSVKAQLLSAGPPLGFFPEYKIGSVPELPLETGDLLVTLTDGIAEAQSPQSDFFGEQRALEVVRANLHRPPAQIVEAIYQAVREFRQTAPAQDDITSLVVKVGPPDPWDRQSHS